MTATPVQVAAAAVGAVFLLVGVAGFVPGLTSDLGDLRWAGHGSGAELLGAFQVSILHNLVHVLFGVVGLGMARSWAAARGFLVLGGLVYAVLFVYGVIVDHGSDANFVPVNDADNALHLALAVAMTAAGMVLGRSRGMHRA